MIVDPVVKGRFKETYEFLNGLLIDKEAVAQRFSVKKVFLEISQNSLKNICARVSFFK